MGKDPFENDNMHDSIMEDGTDSQLQSGLDPWEGASQTEMIEAEAAELNYEGGPRNGIQRGTVIVMAACVLGIAGVFFFSLKNKPKDANAEDQQREAKVDQMLTKFVDEKELTKARRLFEDTEVMIKTFYDYPSKQQVAVDELQRDPFDMPFAKPKPKEDDLAKQRAKRQAELESLLKNLKMQSVIQGPEGAKCMISGEIYGQGDFVQGVFAVQDIQNEAVILAAEGFVFSLTMN